MAEEQSTSTVKQGPVVVERIDNDVGFGQAAADELSKYAPASMRIYIKKAGPYVDKIGTFVNTYYPIFVALWHKAVALYAAIEKYHPEEYFPMAFGIILAFFGGNFVALIAAIEAFKLCGWETTKRCALLLYQDYKVVKEASDRDDLVDDNNDGIADVKQINKRELATRKLKLVIRSCDPEVISEAVLGLNTAILGVIATLRAQFAYTITLGATIGLIISRVAYTALFPVLRQVIPPEYQKWISPIIRYTCRGFGITIAWWLQTLTSAMHSALRGGEQFTKGLVLFLARNGYSINVTEGSYMFAAIMYSVALVGFYWQVINGFSLIFPLNLILFPFTLGEWIVRYVISY
jgi:hypothetical protein